MPRKTALKVRKQPRQDRSRATVDAILEAASQVFRRLGYAAGTTDRIALRAGVSVGSLYQYFPNKDAILIAVVERHLARMMGDIERLLEAEQGEEPNLDALLRRFVLALLEVHERDPHLHHVVFAEAPHPPELHACVLQMEETLAHLVEALLRESDGSWPDEGYRLHFR